MQVKDLSVRFDTGDGQVHAVNNINFSLDAGQTLGIVGESGSGKSQSVLAMMGLLAKNGHATGRVLYEGADLLTMPADRLNQIRGNRVAMIFQDPMTSLNPCFTVGYQLIEVLKAHLGLRGAAAKARAIELLEMVEIPGAKGRMDNYPHQFSGGMSQRVMIAIAIACNPKLLIADEPTTALDVTIQAQIMDLLVSLQKAQGMALVMITHDLAVVAEVAERVAVMYAGQIVEQGPVSQLFTAPAHPYTHALLQAVPERSRGARRLNTLPGMVPGQYDRPTGCLLAPRCLYKQDQCTQHQPQLTEHRGAQVRCFYPLAPAQSADQFAAQSADPTQQVNA